MFAARLTITHKIFAIVAEFAIVLAVLGGVGWWVASTLSRDVEDIAKGGDALVLAARMNTNVQAMNGLQMQVSAEPTAAMREQVTKGLARERELFEQRSAKLVPMLDEPVQHERLSDIISSFSTYSSALNEVLAAADSGDQSSVLAAGKRASAQAAIVREATRAFFQAVEAHEAADRAEAARITQIAEELIAGLALAGLALGCGLAWAVTQFGVTRPLAASVKALEGLAAGDLETEIVGTGRGDEIGNVARAMQVFKDRMIHERDLSAQTEAARAAELARAQHLAELTKGFEQRVIGVLATVGSEVHQLEGTSEGMSHAASSASERAQAAAASAFQAAGNVNTVAAAAEELSGSIAEIGRQVAHANDISHHATAEAGHTDELVRSLADTAARIGDVVATINAIAHQTNMLALNATIEAARAGDAGKGFGVVADEVKHLALKTAEATQEVATQVGEVRQRVEEAVAAIHTITGIIGQVGEASAGIASAVEEQAAATAEIARNVEQAAQGTDDVSGNMAGVQQAAADTGEAAHQVMDIAHGVANDAQALKGMVEEFLSEVRAA